MIFPDVRGTGSRPSRFRPEIVSSMLRIPLRTMAIVNGKPGKITLGDAQWPKTWRFSAWMWLLISSGHLPREIGVSSVNRRACRL